MLGGRGQEIKQTKLELLFEFLSDLSEHVHLPIKFMFYPLYTLNMYCLCLDYQRFKQYMLNNDHFKINLLFSQLGYFYLFYFMYSSYPININYLIFNSLLQQI